MTAAFRLFRQIAVCTVATTLLACSSEPKVETRVSGNDHFVSNSSQPTPIDVAAVEKAFWETKAADFQTWMGQFESRVNEIYDGGVVSLDARRTPQNLLAVTGYLERNDQTGYQSAGDPKLFAIEQTDPAHDNQMAYRVGGHDGHYYHRSHSLLDNPFVQMMVLGNLLNRPYHTPRDRVVVLRDHQNTYRRTPAYQQASRIRKRLFGTTRSQRSFGSASTGGISSLRSWFGRSKTTAPPSPTKTYTGWGGRRSESSSSSGGSRSWFGRSSGSSSAWGSGRSSSSSSSSWSGRRSSGSSFGWGGRTSSSSSGSSRRSWGGRRR